MVEMSRAGIDGHASLAGPIMAFNRYLSPPSDCECKSTRQENSETRQERIQVGALACTVLRFANCALGRETRRRTMRVSSWNSLAYAKA